ncbi:MAG: ComF family protein [Pseudomonadota bacterium]|nr:ComF family protein [Pseudomonadota bacterium]
MLTRLLSALPSQCMVCHAWPARPVCMACAARFARPLHRCGTCALPVPDGVARCGACVRQAPPLHACLAAVAYAWPWAQAIQRFKFAQAPGLAAPLARLMADAPGMAQALADADWLLPLPLSTQRLAERGYNPAHLLARQLLKALPATQARLRADMLLRTRHSPPQSELPRAQRLKNVRGAFSVPAAQAPALHERHVLLLDDVMTTGASLHEAARTLLTAGAKQVTALVLARTEDASA